jgi:hypothetical protein
MMDRYDPATGFRPWSGDRVARPSSPSFRREGGRARAVPLEISVPCCF